MADIFTRYVLKKKKPSIGLLNIGEEESKGTEVLKETYKVLRESSLNFIGNIEGRDFFTGKCDCIICDGFVGNVALKLTEGIIESLTALINVRKETNYEEAGGAQLLGVNGIMIISHGASSSWAMRNAIKKAAQVIEMDVNGYIVSEVTQRDKTKTS